MAEVKQEKEVKIFRNKMQLFPEDMRDRIDRLIMLERGAVSCIKELKLHYRGAQPIPSAETMNRWIEHRKPILLSRSDGELQVQKVMGQAVDLSDCDVKDTRKYLSQIIKFVAWRIEEVKLINAHNVDSRWEKIITDDLRVLLDSISALQKFEDKMGIGQAKVKAVAQVVFTRLGEAVSEAYQEVHGKKEYNKFTLALNNQLGKVNIEELEAKALEAFTKDGEME